MERLPKERSIMTCCAGGYRSSIAASLLKARGFQTIAEIAGGIAAWEAAKLPVTTAQPQSDVRPRSRCIN